MPIVYFQGEYQHSYTFFPRVSNTALRIIVSPDHHTVH